MDTLSDTEMRRRLGFGGGPRTRGRTRSFFVCGTGSSRRPALSAALRVERRTAPAGTAVVLALGHRVVLDDGAVLRLVLHLVGRAQRAVGAGLRERLVDGLAVGLDDAHRPARLLLVGAHVPPAGHGGTGAVQNRSHGGETRHRLKGIARNLWP